MSRRSVLFVLAGFVWLACSFASINYAHSSTSDSIEAMGNTHDSLLLHQSVSELGNTSGMLRQTIPLPPDLTGKITYVCSDNGQVDICVINADGSGGAQNLTQSTTAEAFPRWSADGQRIAFARQQSGSWSLWLMDVDGQNQCKIWDGPGIYVPGVAWHTPLERIYFTPVTVTSGGGPHYLYWVEARCELQSGTQVQNAPATNYLEIDITEDGTQLVASWYTSHSSSSQQEICMFDFSADGNSLSSSGCLTSDGRVDTHPRFSNDGSYVLWYKNDQDLYEADLPQDKQTKLPSVCNESGVRSQFADYSSDDEHIVMARYQNGLRKLWIAKRDCSAMWQLTAGSSNDYMTDWTGPDAELAVRLGYAYARLTGNTVDFIWQTATESGVAGFNLVAETDAELNVLNSELIPSQVIDSVTATTYHLSFETDAAVYFIEEVALDGSVSSFGPFTVGIEYGAYTVTESVLPASYLPLVQQ